jgi:hypothetical protein
LQFFIIDIFSGLVLPIIENKLRKASDGTFYTNGQYLPLSKEESPKEFAFVFVTKSVNTVTETYYTKRAERIRVTYVDNKWSQTADTLFFNMVFLALPFLGFLMFGSAILHKMARTGAITTWTMGSYPDDQVEKILKLYGIPIFASGIIFGWLGRA